MVRLLAPLLLALVLLVGCATAPRVCPECKTRFTATWCCCGTDGTQLKPAGMTVHEERDD